MSRYYPKAYHWLQGLRSSLTFDLFAPLIFIASELAPGDPEHVAFASRCVADALGGDEPDLVGVAGFIRDVAMVGVLGQLTRQQRGLTPDERRIMQEHPVRVAEALKSWERFDPAVGRVAPTVRHHHERWDGHGYPDGLKEGAIPLGARAVAVADAYQAMVSPRPYRAAPLPEQVAKGRLQRAAGTQFDPSAVEAFVEFLDSPRAAN